MKSYSLFFVLFFSTFLFFSCNPDNAREKELLDQIHVLHDIETMPKINSLRKLTEELDSTRTEENSKEISLLKKDLNAADKLMYDWMNNFNWQSDQTPIKERIKYYEKEVETLEVLKLKMNSSMSNATDYLKMNKK